MVPGYDCAVSHSAIDLVYSSLTGLKLPLEIMALQSVRAQGGGDDADSREESGDVITAPEKPELKRPPMYKVVIMNDDYTPMEFVVHVLERFFALPREKATQIMLAIHTTGSGVAGIFPRRHSGN